MGNSLTAPVFVDRQKHFLWDTYRHPGGAVQVDMFTAPMSQQKTVIDTNMEQIGQLPPPHTFLVQSVNFAFLGDTTREAEAQALDVLVWWFRLDRRAFAQCMISQMDIGTYCETDVLRSCEHCSSVHVQMSCPGCGSRRFRVIKADREKPETLSTSRNTYSFELFGGGIFIPPQGFFRVELRSEGHHAPPFTLKCWLKGVHNRAIQ